MRPWRFGIVSPGSPPRPEPLEGGLRWLDAHGHAYKLGKSAIPGEGLHAGTPAERAEDLHRFLRDPEIDALLCARGGSGTLGILPHFDFDLAVRARKPVIGMSDVTALHLALLRHGLSGISASMVVQVKDGMTSYTEERWLALVNGPHSTEPLPFPPDHTPRALAEPAPGGPRARVAEGPLLPCNLSLLVPLIGTPYLQSLAGAILVLEDIQETPQSIDRMIAQLELSGLDRDLAGLILGEFTDCVPRGEGAREEDGRTRLREWARSLGAPVLVDFPYGHEPVTCALPFGTRARMTLDPPSLCLLEMPPGAGR